MAFVILTEMCEALELGITAIIVGFTRLPGTSHAEWMHLRQLSDLAAKVMPCDILR